MEWSVLWQPQAACNVRYTSGTSRCLGTAKRSRRRWPVRRKQGWFLRHVRLGGPEPSQREHLSEGGAECI